MRVYFLFLVFYSHFSLLHLDPGLKGPTLVDIKALKATYMSITACHKIHHPYWIVNNQWKSPQFDAMTKEFEVHPLDPFIINHQQNLGGCPFLMRLLIKLEVWWIRKVSTQLKLTIGTWKATPLKLS